jgi:hypothetical protein
MVFIQLKELLMKAQSRILSYKLMIHYPGQWILLLLYAKARGLSSDQKTINYSLDPPPEACPPLRPASRALSLPFSKEPLEAWPPLEAISLFENVSIRPIWQCNGR